jgi:hypothetical protein
MEIHIGREIKRVLRNKEIKAAHIAKVISTTPQNVNALFKRPSIDSHQLFIISKAVAVDLFILYSSRLQADKNEEVQRDLLQECKQEKHSLEDKFQMLNDIIFYQRKYIDELEKERNTRGTTSNQHSPLAK